MSKKLKKVFVTSVIVLIGIHLSYFVYGYFQFVGIKNIDVYTEFYRFKFYDDVSISHFFISGIFLLLFAFSLWYYSRETLPFLNIFKAGGILLIISFLCFSFFISYSLGLNAKLKTELSEKQFDKDKVLLNTLYPFLYNYTSYTSENLFNFQNILYPKPYPVILDTDTILYKIHDQEIRVVESKYYSIDTLKVAKIKYNKIKNYTDTICEIVGFDKKELTGRIISKKITDDSVKIAYKAVEMHPEYDDSICVFVQNKILFSPVNEKNVYKQQLNAAINRYKLLYKYSQDSLVNKIKELDTLFKKYNIESNIGYKELTKDIFYYRDNKDEPLNGIRNGFDRKTLKERFTTLNKLFYHPNFLHPLIQDAFFSIVFIVWLILFFFFLLINFKYLQSTKNKK